MQKFRFLFFVIVVGIIFSFFLFEILLTLVDKLLSLYQFDRHQEHYEFLMYFVQHSDF